MAGKDMLLAKHTDPASLSLKHLPLPQHGRRAVSQPATALPGWYTKCREGSTHRLTGRDVKVLRLHDGYLLSDAITRERAHEQAQVPSTEQVVPGPQGAQERAGAQGAFQNGSTILGLITTRSRPSSKWS